MKNRKMYKGIAAIAAAVAVAAAGVGIAAPHDPVIAAELTGYIVTVNASGDPAELAAAQTVLDLYKIADASGEPGTADFVWTPAKGFETLRIDDDDWTAVAQDALGMALTSMDGVTMDQVAPAAKGKAVGEKITLPDPGLYLIVPHGSSLNDYLITIDTADAVNPADDTAKSDTSDTADTSAAGDAATPSDTRDSLPNGTRLATIAKTRTTQYTFAPQIVSLPGKEGPDALTDNEGTWLDDMTLVMKYSTSDLLTSLKIQKTLLSYETKDPATFVFRVDGYRDGYDTGERVYSDVVSLVFTGAEVRSTELDDVPIGAYVTVTEIYSGAVYHASDGETRQLAIRADGENTAAFSNDYTPTPRGGGSVTNQFHFNQDENRWNDPDQVYDTSATGRKEE